MVLCLPGLLWLNVKFGSVAKVWITSIGNADQRHRRRKIRHPATTGQALRATWPIRAVLALDCCRVPGTWSGFAQKVHVVHSKDQGLLPFVICFRFDDCRCIVCPKFRRWPYASFGDEKFKSGRRCVEILQDQLRDNVVLLISRIFS